MSQSSVSESTLKARTGSTAEPSSDEVKPKKVYEKQSLLDLALAAFRFAAFFFVGILWAVPYCFAVPFSLLRSALQHVLPRNSRILELLKIPFNFAIGSFGYCCLSCLGIRVRHLNAACESRYKHSRAEHKPNIVAFQHVCIADPLLMCDLVPEARYVLKHELNVIFWLFYPALVNGFVSVRRSSSESRAKCQKDIIDSIQVKNYSIAIAPEGTRNTGDVLKLLPFKLGAFVASVTTGEPIIPVVHWNADNAWTHSAGALFARPTMILVEFLDPVYPLKDDNGNVTEKPEELAQRVRDAMQKALDEHHPDEKEYTLSTFDKYVTANIPAVVLFTVLTIIVKCLVSLFM